MVVFTLQYSVYLAMSAVLNSLVEPYDYTPTDATIIGVAFVCAGMAGSILFSFILDKYHCYVALLRVITLFTSILMAAILYTLPSRNTLLLSINMGLLGLFNVPIIPIGFSLASEITFPVSVTLAQGIFLLLTQSYGTGLSYLATYIIEQMNRPLTVIGIVLCQFILSFLLSFFVKEDLRRLKMGKEMDVAGNGHTDNR